MVEEWQNHSEFPMKRIRFKEIRDDKDEDRISRLPDCLLVEILSRLPDTKCAVRTGALSKRWKHIWTLVPVLCFLHRDNPNADFFSFVDKTLTQRGQLKLKELTLYSTYNHQFESQVRSWIRYAINCNVEDINMMLWDLERRIRFQLDQFFYINSCFTDLTLRGCEFNPIGAISWTKLGSLCITNARLDEDLIENILSGSPVLETLMLKECFGYTRLNITSKSVKKLVFYGYTANGDILCDDYGDVVEINAPNILSLMIQDHLLLSKILLINVSSLVEADLDYLYCGDYETTLKEAEEEMLKGFIINLHHVKEVKIGESCFKVLFRLKAKGFILPSNLKICDVSSYSLESDNDSLELSDRSNSDSDDGPTCDESDGEDDAIASSNEGDGA